MKSSLLTMWNYLWNEFEIEELNSAKFLYFDFYQLCIHSSYIYSTSLSIFSMLAILVGAY